MEGLGEVMLFPYVKRSRLLEQKQETEKLRDRNRELDREVAKEHNQRVNAQSLLNECKEIKQALVTKLHECEDAKQRALRELERRREEDADPPRKRRWRR